MEAEAKPVADGEAAGPASGEGSSQAEEKLAFQVIYGKQVSSCEGNSGPVVPCLIGAMGRRGRGACCFIWSLLLELLSMAHHACMHTCAQVHA